MEKKWYAGIVVIISILIIGLVIFTNNLSLNPQENECEVILENEGKNKIDIVFLTNNVLNTKIEDYSDYLLESEPFSYHKEKFNFYYAGDSDCNLIKENILLCYSNALIKKSSACPNDYIVILSDKPSNIRSSSYINVASININHPPSVLLHEFGHIFANLADEYVPSVIPRGSKNCAEECEEFEIKDGCYEGCSKNSYYRSSENSVMRTLKIEEYKKLNTKLIEENLNEYN